MTTPQELDFNLYHTNAAIKIAEFLGSDIFEVSAYKRYDDVLPGSVVSFEFVMADASSPEDVGSEQWQADVRFAAFVIVPFTNDENLKECRRLALKLAGKIYGQRFGCTIGPAKVVSCAPDSLALPGKSGRANEAEEYEVYRVEWTHEAFIGPSVWDVEAGITPPILVITGNGEIEEVAP